VALRFVPDVPQRRLRPSSVGGRWYIIGMVFLILYIAVVSYFIIIPSLDNIITDPFRFLMVLLLVLIPSYGAVMLAIYKHDGIRRDLTHIVFVILVGLSISLLFTLQNEWVPRPSTESNVFFSNMSVSIERTSPLTIPIRSIVPYSPDSVYPLRVFIYNYTSIQPVSISMTPPPTTVFKYDRFERNNRTDSDAYDVVFDRFVYSSNIRASHTGQVFNNTDQYVVNIDYRVLPNLKNNSESSKQSVLGNIITVPISNITSTHPLNRSYTVDNNIKTKWSAEGDGQSITYVFDKSYNVTKVGIAFFRGDLRQNLFEISGQRFNSSGKTTGFENFTLNPPLLNAKTLQIIGHGNSGGGNSKIAYNAFSEVKLYANITDLKGNAGSTVSAADQKIYRNSVPFQWTVKMTDLSLATYFWIVMAGVVTSRFMSLILDKLEKPSRRRGEQHEDFQIIGGREGLGILFSFIIALVLFSSFKEQATSLTTVVLFNISIAFAFGFGFDKTLEVAPRFSPHYVANKREAEANRNNE
jgi:hypothetical protein